MLDYVTINNDLKYSLRKADNIVGEITGGFVLFGYWFICTDAGYIYQSTDGLKFIEIFKDTNYPLFSIGSYTKLSNTFYIVCVAQNTNESGNPQTVVFELKYTIPNIVTISGGDISLNNYSLNLPCKSVTYIAKPRASAYQTITILVFSNGDSVLLEPYIWNYEDKDGFAFAIDIPSIPSGIKKIECIDNVIIMLDYQNTLSFGEFSEDTYGGCVFAVENTTYTNNILYSDSEIVNKTWKNIKKINDIVFAFAGQSYVLMIASSMYKSYMTPIQIHPSTNPTEYWDNIMTADGYYILSSNKNRYTDAPDLVNWSEPTTITHLPTLKSIGNIAEENISVTHLTLRLYNDPTYNQLASYIGYRNFIINRANSELIMSEYYEINDCSDIVNPKLITDRYQTFIVIGSNRLYYFWWYRTNNKYEKMYHYFPSFDLIDAVIFTNGVCVLTSQNQLYYYQKASLQVSTLTPSPQWTYSVYGNTWNKILVNKNKELIDFLSEPIILLGTDGFTMVLGSNYNSTSHVLIEDKNWIDGFFYPLENEDNCFLCWIFSSDGYMTTLSETTNNDNGYQYGEYPEFDHTLLFTGLEEIKWVDHSDKYVMICDSLGNIKYSIFNWYREIKDITITTNPDNTTSISSDYKYNSIIWSDTIKVCQDGDIPSKLICTNGKFYLYCTNGIIYTSLIVDNWCRHKIGALRSGESFSYNLSPDGTFLVVPPKTNELKSVDVITRVST